MALVDITDRKLADEVLANVRHYAKELVAVAREPLVVLDMKACVLAASAAFIQSSQLSSMEIQGRSLYELGGGRWNVPVVHKLLEEQLVKE